MDVIVDVDGTLSDPTHRLHFIKTKPKDWPAFFDACKNDAPNAWVCNLVLGLIGDPANKIIFCSGRPERVRQPTVQWLQRFLWSQSDKLPLYMRKDDDFREDSVIKREMLQRMRNDGFKPVLAIEDRSQVVKMWRAEGLTCAQVAEGDFQDGR